MRFILVILTICLLGFLLSRSNVAFGFGFIKPGKTLLVKMESTRKR